MSSRLVGTVAAGYLESTVPTLGKVNVNLGVLPAVFRPLRTVFPGLGADFLNLGGKTEGTAKQWGKNGEIWARNGLKRVGSSGPPRYDSRVGVTGLTF